jgi:hypothetical protein
MPDPAFAGEMAADFLNVKYAPRPNSVDLYGYFPQGSAIQI